MAAGMSSHTFVTHATMMMDMNRRSSWLYEGKGGIERQVQREYWREPVTHHQIHTELQGKKTVEEPHIFTEAV